MRQFGFLFIMLLTVASIGCDGDSSTNTSGPVSSEVSIQFQAVAGDVDISCDATLTGLGTTAVSASLADFRFFVHDIALIDAAGQEIALTLEENDWQSSDIALLDFQNKTDSCTGETKDTHTAVTGTVAANLSDIAGITFKLGIPAELNHSDQAAAVSPLNITSMFWTWNAGYKFIRADVAPEGGLTRPDDAEFSGSTFNLHLGSTGCSGDATQGEAVECTNKNLTQISFASFDSTSQAIKLDYADIVKAQNLSQDLGGAPGCMSGTTDPECSSIFTTLGLDLATGAVAATSASAFTVVDQ
ncbi:MAG: metallo-mystery pair system four-Cys motif protein [Pseudobacteriovorax sp.]|nr:metallo-mystery pair system four-Cys motif protein [Pseudobacteriovorax sp.]